MKINRNWIICGLGILLVLLSFAGLPSETERIVMIVIGIAIVVMSFWKETRRVVDQAEKDFNSAESITK